MPWVMNGPALRAQRERRGFNLAGLAAKIGIDESTLRRHETGRFGNARAPLVTALARALECETGIIATYVEHPPPRASSPGPRLGTWFGGTPARRLTIDHPKPAAPLLPEALREVETAFRA